MKLEGSISIFPLRELIDMVAYSSVTGVLNVFGLEGNGHCFFRDGRLYHVTNEQLSGPAALEALFAAQNSHFTFVSDSTVDEETIWGNIQYLLDSSEQNAERWHRVNAKKLCAGNTPHLRLSLEAAERNAPHLASLIALIDGSRTISMLQQELHWELIDLYEALTLLVEQSVISFEALPPRTKLPSLPRTPSAIIEPGIFERIMQRTT